MFILSKGEKMNYNQVKIKSIKKVGKGRVVNLTVSNNHTFITKNGIITHNCDRLSTQALDILKKAQVDNAENCSIIGMTNHIERFPEANLSRFGGGTSLLPNNKKDIARMKKMFYDRALFILDSENVHYEVIEKKKGDKVIKLAPVVQKIITKNYPDFRTSIIDLQEAYAEYGEINENALNMSKSTGSKIIKALKDKVKPSEMLAIASEVDPTGFIYTFAKEMPKLLSDESLIEAYQIYSFYNSSCYKAITKDGHLGSFVLELLSAQLVFKDKN